MSELTPNLPAQIVSSPILESVPEAASTPAVEPARWKPGTRVAFRFAFCYFMLYALCCGNATIWEVIPFHIGEHLENWTSWPFFHVAQWLGHHMFHLTGVGAKLHDTGSGDTILNLIAVVSCLPWPSLQPLSGPRLTRPAAQTAEARPTRSSSSGSASPFATPC